MSKIRTLALVGFFILVTIQPILAQDIAHFFESEKSYSGFQIKQKKRSLTGELKSFIFDKWVYSDARRASNTGVLFSNIDISNIVTSNAIALTLTHKERGKLFVEGGEIQFLVPISLHALGYDLYTSNKDINSEYYVIAYVKDNNYAEDFLVYSWRMIMFFNSDLELEGEIIGATDSYFVKGEYRYLKRGAQQLQDSSFPSIFTLEKKDQSVIAVINVYSSKVMWKVDNLSFSDQTAIGIFTGVLNTMRFSLGKSGKLARKKYYKDKQKKKNDSDFLFEIEDILLPEELGQ